MSSPEPHHIVEVVRGKTVEVVKTLNQIEITTRGAQGTRGPQSNRTAFVVGTTNGDEITAGVKGAYLTVFDGGKLTDWVLRSNERSSVSVRLLRSTPATFPVFTTLFTIDLEDGYSVSGVRDITLDPLDVLDIEVVSNTMSTKIGVEMRIA
jgi:hypothetical protein